MTVNNESSCRGCAARNVVIKSLEKQVVHYIQQSVSIQALESERAANEKLTNELEAEREKCAGLLEALKKIDDATMSQFSSTTAMLCWCKDMAHDAIAQARGTET